MNHYFHKNDNLTSSDAREKPRLVLKNETSFGKAAAITITEKARAFRY
jgi:hypothetical protein